MAGLRCRPGSAPPCSPTMSATPGTWSLPRTAWSTSTPGAAAITPTPRTPRRRTAASCWRCRTRPAAAVPTRSFASARESRAAMPAGRESHFITARCSRRPTTASSATPCRRARSRRPGRPRSSFRGCRSPATIPCIRSRSMRRAPCTSTSAPPPMPASGRTEFRILRASSRARSSRRGPASGAMTPTAPVSSSRPPSASPPGCATAKASHSTPPAGYSRPSTGGISCARTGPRSTPRSRAPTSRRKSLSSWNAAPTSAGRIATSI